MTTLVVLFNLKSGVTAGDYEAWAKSTDLPIVRGLKSIDGFTVYRSAALLGSDAPPPYAYSEIIHVNDMDQFGTDVGAENMQKVAAEFQTFADNPLFILSHSIESH
jgi:REDY-like protein HapK